MNDLKIVRENFNKVIDCYEQEGITTEELDRRYTEAITKTNIFANYLIEDVIGKRVPIFDEETKQKIVNSVKSLVGLSIDTGMRGFVSGLANTEFVEGSLNGQGTIKE